MEQYQNEDEKNKGSLRVGDIVCFTFVEKVYENHSKGKHEEIERDFLLAKYTEKPELEYKGVIFCKIYCFYTSLADGVTNKNFNVIPKQSDESLSASSLYKKCLFRIDLAMECDY